MEEITTFSRLLETLHAQPVLTLFLILGMGYLIGGIRMGSFTLRPVAGVLFAGLFIEQKKYCRFMINGLANFLIKGLRHLRQ